MDLGTIRQINIDNEMQASYLDYAMSVIVARALPDVRDGLKPVHRRILYAMHDLGLDPDKPYKKSARIVGEVLGKYHPHGDAAVYEAMVRMAQDFSLRYPLVDGQGNFGSIDGDNAAAMRYTEARLARIATEMLNDIDKDTVDWTDNFDGTLTEPSVLPAALPNLVVNGASGIAVGMSTNIPPHNLGEVVDALCYLIDNYAHAEEVTIEELMRFIPGPDFPTGGLIYRYQHENGADGEEQVDVIARAYASGRGRIVVQAKAHIEDMSRNRSRIVVTELPYQTNKTNLLERIAELVRDGRLEGVTDLRDESDRTGMRICIEMTRTVEPRDVLADLYRLTPLQSTFSISLLALVEGEPRLLSLKRLLLHFLEHRQEVIRRRSEHDLAKARQRAHILEGLLRALDVLDEVIALIRKSRTADTAKRNLMEQFKFTEIQAQAILDMQLRRLAALERQKLQDEYKAVLALIKELEELLASPKKVLALIRKNLMELKATYDDPRRTQIADRVKGALTAVDVLPDQEVWVTLAADGTLARRSKEPMNAAGLRRLASEAGAALVSTHTRHDLYLLSAKGQVVRVPVHQVPEAGAHFADLTNLTRRDRVAVIRALPKPQADAPLAGFLVMGTAQGQVKRINLPDLGEQAHTDPLVFRLDAGDELAWADVSTGGGEIMLATSQGQVIRFAEDDVRAMGLPAGGVTGIRLQRQDFVVDGLVAPAGAGNEEITVATVTTLGWGKQTPLAEFPTHGRGGQGVQAGRFSERTGKLAGMALLSGEEALVCLTAGKTGRLVQGDEAPVAGRATMGKQLFAATANSAVRAVIVVPGAGGGRRTSAKPAGGQETTRRETSRRGTSSRAAAKKEQPSLLPDVGGEAKPAAAAKKVVAAAATGTAAKAATRRKSAPAARTATSGKNAVPAKRTTTGKSTPAATAPTAGKTTGRAEKATPAKSATTRKSTPSATAPTADKAAGVAKTATTDKAASAVKTKTSTRSATTAKSASAAAPAKGASTSKSAPAAKATATGKTAASAEETTSTQKASPGKRAPAKKADSAAKATATGQQAATSDTGARVFDRAELPLVMPSPRRAPKQAATPDAGNQAAPPQPDSSAPAEPGKPPAGKKTAKPAK